MGSNLTKQAVDGYGPGVEKLNAKVVVFSKYYCPYCAQALDIFAKYPIKSEDFEVVELANNEKCGEIQDYLFKITGARTVPRIFINGECIGGFDDAQGLHESGKLREILMEAKAIPQPKAKMANGGVRPLSIKRAAAGTTLSILRGDNTNKSAAATRVK